MSSKVITIFYPKVVEPKVKITPKLKIKERMKLSNMNYIDVLSQIRSNKNDFKDTNLYMNLLLKKNQKQNFLRYKLFNKNTRIHTALITEPNRDNNQLNKYKELSNNFTAVDSYTKTRSINNKYLTTPKRLINKIIKFEEEKKRNKKNKINEKKRANGINK